MTKNFNYLSLFGLFLFFKSLCRLLIVLFIQGCVLFFLFHFRLFLSCYLFVNLFLEVLFILLDVFCARFFLYRFSAVSLSMVQMQALVEI